MSIRRNVKEGTMLIVSLVLMVTLLAIFLVFLFNIKPASFFREKRRREADRRRLARHKILTPVKAPKNDTLFICDDRGIVQRVIRDGTRFFLKNEASITKMSLFDALPKEEYTFFKDLLAHVCETEEESACVIEREEQGKRVRYECAFYPEGDEDDIEGDVIIRVMRTHSHKQGARKKAVWRSP